MYVGGYYNLVWFGLLLALVLARICRDCNLIKEFTKLLYLVSSQWQISCILVGSWPRLTLSTRCPGSNDILAQSAHILSFSYCWVLQPIHTWSLSRHSSHMVHRQPGPSPAPVTLTSTNSCGILAQPGPPHAPTVPREIAAMFSSGYISVFDSLSS